MARRGPHRLPAARRKLRPGSTTGGRRLVEESRSGSSYLSQGDLRLHFGLGDRERVESLEIRWPEGGIQRVEDAELGEGPVLTIRQKAP